MEIREKLSKIQQEMKAPKRLWNDYGKYNYRNAEGILESFKPYEQKYNVFLVLRDEIISVCDRVYVKATAQLYDLESDFSVSTTAFAREPLAKKGMDESQITGTASSYARKYALNGLFLLDDTKDADTNEFHDQVERGKKDAKEAAKRIAVKKKIVTDICQKHGLDPVLICSGNGYIWDELTETQVENMIASLKKKFGDES